MAKNIILLLFGLYMYKKEKFGNKPYKCAIVACIHPNEDAGLKIFDLLRKNCSQLDFTLITTHSDKRKGRLPGENEKNLNRLFNLPPYIQPKSKETLLARALYKELSKYELVIDIHSTNFQIPPYWVVVKLTSQLEGIVMLSDIPRVLILNYKNTLIAAVKNGIGIEIGKNNYEEAILNAYKNLELILVGSKTDLKNTPPLKKRKKLDYFVNIGEITKDFVDRLDKNIEDFKHIKREDLLGYKKNKKVYSPLNFYPLWVEKGMIYKNYYIACHILKRINEDYFF